MNYSNSAVRRQDRLLEEPQAVELLKTAQYGILSMCDKTQKAYGIPISYVWDGNNSIYLHCAPEGQKLRYIDANSNVSFCLVGRTNVISEKFTTEYESTILECEAHRNLPEEERFNALSLILDKYSPEDKIVGLKYAKASFSRTEIIRLDIKNWSGKCKKVKQK